MENKKKFTWQIVATLIACMVFAYGILHAIVGTPQTSKLAEENRIKIAVVETCISNMARQLDRIEKKLDDYAKRNGHNDR